MGGDTLMATKECPKCGETKSLEEYYPHKLTRDGRETNCIACELLRRIPSNKARMYVNGKYVPKKHPLHKPGKYKTFEDAAFSSLKNYELSREGQIYIITNPSFPGWVKVGMAVDAKDRLSGYQTSSPFRDYSLYHSWSVEDRRSTEADAHKQLDKRFERRGEWFKCSPEEAKSVIAYIVEEEKSEA